MCTRNVAPAEASLQGIMPDRQSTLQSTSATGFCTCVQRLKLVGPPPLVIHVAECKSFQMVLRCLASQCSSESPSIHTNFGTGLGSSP